MRVNRFGKVSIYTDPGLLETLCLLTVCRCSPVALKYWFGIEMVLIFISMDVGYTNVFESFCKLKKAD